MTGRFERKLRAAIAIYTKCAGGEHVGNKDGREEGSGKALQRWVSLGR